MLETPFANLYDVARYYLAILPYRLLLRYPFRNDRQAHRLRCPVLVLHGKRDKVGALCQRLEAVLAALAGHPPGDGDLPRARTRTWPASSVTAASLRSSWTAWRKP